ncbi:ADP-ribosylglycohydrolase family protein [Sediminispirochaeta bajacaliforniensis]|uniref:ADP-ribosylglycohydrolase family protein n=1 Tax=Sediminispirochaeta bajacaliforniensis TaxID=148 RepID=UPI00037D8954|nr:ADP-ribosylglycohydrolase family protein [Sediminispirochaeta bajacaliforniensis]
MMIQSDYPERVYAGLLGKCIGVRLGAPVEPTVWSYERIRETYGDITGYVKDYKNFAADDDVNGPLFFIRALYDYGEKREITAEDIGNCWLNYTREGRGFYWWGGYGRSTEHTAYLNLKHGIPAPSSGSLERNGATVAEQIGGQIFIDSWGLIFPDNPEAAARYGEMAASVSHDRNGIYGGRFIASAIAAAFSLREPEAIIEKALSFIPQESEYARVTRAVMDFYHKNSDDFRACRAFLEENFGYDRYPGVCHIIPNAGVCILSLLYGKGSLSRSVEIATMCGWDTDCNAGNVGTIMGVACGLDGVEEKYRGPINDFHAASSIAGSLNILDLPTEAKRLALLGYRMAGERSPESLASSTPERQLLFDFPFPGATHGFRSSDSRYLTLSPGRDGTHYVLSALVDRLPRYQKKRLFYKSFYRREDFSDERYLPAFTPLVYSGQSLCCRFRWDAYSEVLPAISLYVRTTGDKSYLESRPFFPKRGADGVLETEDLCWTIPDTGGRAIDEIGITVEGREKELCFGKLLLHRFSTEGRGTQTLDFSKECVEFDTITQTTYDGGAWMLEESHVQAICPERNELYTGNFYTRDLLLRTTITPEHGESHMLILRAKGRRHGYFVGFDGKDRVRLMKNDNGLEECASVAFPWRHGRCYEVESSIRGDTIIFSVEGQKVLEYCDPAPYRYGMYGLAQLSASRTLFGSVVGEEL